MNNLKKSVFIFFVIAAYSNAFSLMNQSQPELHAAAEAGDKQRLTRLLASGADVNTREAVLCKTALHLAVEEKHNALIPILVEAGIDLDAIDHMHETALSKALIANNWDAIQILLDAGACPNEPEGETPLESALQEMTATIHVLDVEHPEHTATTQSIIKEILRALILAGADIRILDNEDICFTSQALQSDAGRWLPRLLDKLVQADSNISQTWLQSSRFLQAFVALGKAERKAFIERVLKAQEMSNDLVKLIVSFLCK